MFRRYEKHIFTILQSWPQPCFFVPSPFAATTFSARLRDAIVSVIEYKWASAVDVGRLEELWNTDLEIGIHEASTGSQVCARKRGTGAALQLAGELVDTLHRNNYLAELDNPSRPILHALAILMSEKVITQPVKIKNIDQALMSEVAEKHDVGFSPEGDVTIML